MRVRRDDDTLFLVPERPKVRVPEGLTLEDAVQQLAEARQLVSGMRHMVKDALQNAHAFVMEASEGMEFDLEQVRARMKREGVHANLRAFRTGSLYKRSTQFDLLQRLDSAFDSLCDGRTANVDIVMSEEED